MDRNLQRTSACWIILLFSMSTLTESRLVHSRGSFNAANSHVPSRTVQPQLFAVRQQQQQRRQQQQQQQSAELVARPRPVVVKCHPDSMEVVVQADMFGRGLLVDGKHLHLGSDSVREEGACGAVPSGEAEFTIQAHLTDCGTKLSSTKEKIIYSTVLVYSPEPSSDGLLRQDGATIPLECHYDKRYAVDAISLHPAWVPFIATAAADDQIDFSLQLMTDDWLFERGSYTYFLGDPINFEVSVIMGNHMPLRVYVDHCVATETPDAKATLRYDFIEQYGCLADAYLTNSSSHFLPRAAEHTLRFQLDAFRFHQEPNNQVYITCYLKAVPVTSPVSSQNRACSFFDNRWLSVDGNDQACRSCDLSHQVEEPPSREPPTTTISTKAWQDMTSQESFVQNSPKHHAASLVRGGCPKMHQSQHSKPQQHSVGLMKRDADYKAERTVQLGPLFVTLPTNSTTVLSAKKKAASDSGLNTGDC